MSILSWYDTEIKEETRFFIIDTFLQGSLIVDHNDVDFKEYRWDTKINNRIRQGDLFIYLFIADRKEIQNIKMVDFICLEPENLVKSS